MTEEQAKKVIQSLKQDCSLKFDEAKNGDLAFFSSLYPQLVGVFEHLFTIGYQRGSIATLSELSKAKPATHSQC